MTTQFSNLQVIPFIQAYRAEATAWAEQYKTNDDPETFSCSFFYGKFEKALLEKLIGFEEEKFALRRCREEAHRLYGAMLRINQAAEMTCMEHYNAHLLEYGWPTSPENFDHSPVLVTEDFEPTYNKGFFKSEQGVLIIGHCLLSWHPWKYSSDSAQTYYMISLGNGEMITKRKVWNSDLPRARKPLLRHAQAIDFVQQLSRLCLWPEYDKFSNKQKRAVSRAAKEMLDQLGTYGN